MTADTKISRRAMLGATATGIVGTIAGCSSVLGGNGSGGSASWTNVDGDAANTGAALDGAGPSSKPERTPLYEPDGFSGFSTVPVYDGSTIAVWGSDDSLHAVDTDGTHQWSFSVEMDYLLESVSPAMQDGTVYVPTGSNVVAVADGERQWAISGPSSDLHSPRVDERGLYLGSPSALARYDLDGTERWTKTGLSGDRYPPAIGEDYVVTLATEGGGGFFGDPTYYTAAHRIDDGEQVWRKESVAAGGRPVVVDGTIYAFDPTGEESFGVVALSVEDGSVQWTSDPIGDPAGGSPAVTEDAVYAASESELYALDPADGSMLWDQPYTMLDSTDYPPRTDGDAVYMLLGGQTVVSVDADTGEENWSFGFDRSISVGGLSNIAIADGSIYTSRDALVELR